MSKFCYTTKRIKELAKLGEKTVGQKAFYLIKFKRDQNLQDAIPDFGIITNNLFANLINKLADKIGDIEKVSQTLTQKQLSKEISELFKEYKLKSCIEKIFKSIKEFSAQGIAIRPSATFMTYKNTSILSGLLPTFLNIRTPEEALLTLKKILKFVFSSELLDYFHLNHIPLKELVLSFILQKMIVPEASGVAYPYNPITLNPNQMIIEAIFGLGTALSNGEIIPDTYVINKTSDTILEKRITPQSWMYIPKPIPHSLQQIQKISLSNMVKYTQKVDDNTILKIGQLVNYINTRRTNPLLLEWSTIGNKIYFLQAKRTATITKQDFTFRKQNKTTQEPTPLLQGLPLYPGEAIGIIKKIETNTGSLDLPAQDFIIVAPTLPRTLLIKLAKNAFCKGFIFDIVPPASDTAELLSKYKKPAIGSTFNATKMLKEGQVVHLQAQQGKVLLIKTTQRTSARNSKATIKKKSSNAKKKITSSEIITVFNQKDVGVYTTKQMDRVIYIIPFAKTSTIKKILKESPNAEHIIVSTLHTPSSISKQYFKFPKYIILSLGFIVESFIEIPEILNKIVPGKIYYVLINLQKLYQTTYKSESSWYLDSNFIEFIKPLIKQFNNMSYIKLVNITHAKSRITQNLIKRLIELGFTGILKE